MKMYANETQTTYNGYEDRYPAERNANTDRSVGRKALARGRHTVGSGTHARAEHNALSGHPIGSGAYARAGGAVVLKTLALIAALSIVVACHNPFGGSDGPKRDDAGHDVYDGAVASFVVEIGSPLQPFTVMPDFPSPSSYNITVSRDGFEPEIAAGETATTVPFTDVPVGVWSVEVDGLDGSGTKIASGTASVDVGTDTEVTVTLAYLSGEGQGTLELDVTFPDTAEVAQVDYTKTPYGGSPGTTTQPTITDDTGENSSIHIDETSVDAGPYIVLLEFKNASGTVIASVIESVHVYANLSTSADGTAEIALAPTDFNSPPPVPASFTVVDNEDRSAGLSWDASVIYTETNFVIERHESSDFSDASPAEFIIGANSVSYDDSSVTPGTTTYYYRVKSRNSFGDSAWAEETTGITVTNVATGGVSIHDNTALLNYAGYTWIQGNLSIANISLSDLSELELLERVDGSVYIQDCSGLTSVSGLHNLTDVGGLIYISGNAALTDLSELSVTGTIDRLEVDDTALTSLTGLEGITAVTNDVHIHDNASLQDIPLTGLTTVEGYLDIQNNYQHATLNLGALETVGSYFRIDDSDQLSTVLLPALTSVGSDFHVTGNDKLSDFQATAAGLTIGGYVEASLNGPDSGTASFVMSGLTTVEKENLNNNGIYLYDNNFTSIDISATATTGSVTVDNNDRLETLTIDSLESIGYGLVYFRNSRDIAGTATASFAALESAAWVEFDGYYGTVHDRLGSVTLGTAGTPLTVGSDPVSDYLRIQDFDHLTSIDLGGLTQVNGYLNLYGNDLCATLAAPSLQTVDGYLQVNRIKALTDLALPALTSVTGNMHIEYNDLLETISDMGTDLAIGGRLDVEHNPLLTGTTGLNEVASVGEYIDVDNNAPASGTPSFTMTGLSTVGGSGGMGIEFWSNNFTDITIGATSVDGYVNFYLNPYINAVTIDNLTTIGGYLSYERNSEELTGNSTVSFAGLESVGEYILFDGLYSGYRDKLQSLTLGTAGTPLVVGTNDGTNAYYFTLREYDQLTSLSALGLTTVYGDVTISSWDAGNTDLSGLDNLTTVGGTLNITGNDDITSLSGLGSLDSIGGALELSGNPSLTSLSGASLSGLDSLTQIGQKEGGTRGLYIYDIDTLEGLSGLESLQSIAGDLHIRDCDNAAFTSLSPLSTSLTSVGGTIYLRDNASIESLTGLEALSGTIAGDLYFYNNAQLADISALDAITQVDGNVTVETLPNLTSVGLDSLSSVGGSFGLHNCDAVPDLDPLTALTSVGDALYISGNASLADLGNTGATRGLYQLATIGGTLNLSSNDNLSDVSALSNVTVIGSAYPSDYKSASLYLSANPELSSLVGLDAITEIRGDLRIDDCGTEIGSELTDLTDLDAVQTVNGRIYISWCHKLTTLFGASSALTAINGDTNDETIRISNNNGLVDLAGVTGSGTGVTTVDEVYIQSNPALTSLSGLDNITNVEVYVDINDNDALTDCSALDSIDTIDGSATIRIINNAQLTDMPDMPLLDTPFTTLNLDGNGTTGTHLIADLGFTAMDSVTNLYVRSGFFDSASYSGDTAIQSWYGGWTGTVANPYVSGNSYE